MPAAFVLAEGRGALTNSNILKVSSVVRGLSLPTRLSSLPAIVFSIRFSPPSFASSNQASHSSSSFFMSASFNSLSVIPLRILPGTLIMTSSGKSRCSIFASAESTFACTSSLAVFAYFCSSFRGPGLVKSLPRRDLPMAELGASPNISKTSLFIGSFLISVTSVSSATASARGATSPSSDKYTRKNLSSPSSLRRFLMYFAGPSRSNSSANLGSALVSATILFTSL